MNRKVVGGLLVLAAGAFAIWFFLLRGGSKPTTPTSAVSTAGSGADPWADGAKPHRPEGAGANGGGGGPPRGGEIPEWSLDPDVEGSITLEGQVVDATGNGVGGAIVTISSVPTRTVTAQDDGSFAIDKLVGRDYELTAHQGLLVGKLNFKVTAQPEQAVIHVAEGASVEVTVVDEKAKPISGAKVVAGELEEIEAKSGADGIAALGPVEPGYVDIRVTAEGYAPASTFTTVGSSGAKGALKVTLHPGFALSGLVVDEQMTPIQGARVTVSAGPWGGFGGNSTRDPILSNEKGEFVIPAVAPGRHTLRAVDGEHAPASSTPITVVDKAITGVEIKLKAGGTLTGIVIDVAKQPVPYATVRVAGTGQNRWLSTPRQTTSDAQGKFVLKGLARGKLQARAESDMAASKLTDVDLETQLAVSDLKLVVDITGVIAGHVVDEKGAPVPEVEVNAFPDFFANGGSKAAGGIALAGRSTATTDGDGAFTLHGLDDGSYRLWASRSGASRMDWGAEGVTATPGDKAVKIVLSTPGKLKGVIAIDGVSTPPRVATVTVGVKAPTPAQQGAFEVSDLTPGEWDVSFRGPEFAQMTKRKIKIESGKTTDLGTVTVFRGRRLSGKVVNSSGQPVANAKVKLADILFTAEGDNGDNDASVEDLYGVRTGFSDQDGAFTIIGVPEKGTQAAAYADSGSSIAVAIPPGKDDPLPITLTLRGYGSVVGTVTRKGQPVPNVGVSQSTKGGGAQMGMSRTDENGAFTMAKVPEGPIVIQAMQQQMMSMRTASVTITVTAGQQTTAKVEFPVGEIELDVTVKPVAGATVNFAQVVLVPGQVAVGTAKELMDLFTGGGTSGLQTWTGGGPVKFTETLAGGYTLCTVPITGNMSDPTFLQRLQESMLQLKVYCKAVTVTAAPTTQPITVEVPGQPLPDLPPQ